MGTDRSVSNLREGLSLSTERQREIDMEFLLYVKGVADSPVENFSISRCIEFADESYEGMERVYALYNAGWMIADLHLFRRGQE